MVILLLGAESPNTVENRGGERMTKDHDFVKGVTMGVVTGAALGMVMAPRKKTSMKKAAGKAMKTMGQVMENFSDEMGF